MLKNESELSVDDKVKIDIADLLLPLDPLPSQSEAFQMPSPVWDEIEKEQTEVLRDHMTGTDTNIIQPPVLPNKKRLHRFLVFIFAAILVGAMCFFSFYET